MDDLAAARPATATTAVADVCLTVAALNARVGRLSYADALLAFAATRAPDDLRVLRLRAHVLIELHRPAEALALLNRLAGLEEAPRSGEGSPRDLLFARALLAQGRLGEARERFARHVASRTGSDTENDAGAADAGVGGQGGLAA